MSRSWKRRRLRDIIYENSLLKDREFMLASGARSKYYFDMKMTTMADPETDLIETGADTVIVLVVVLAAVAKMKVRLAVAGIAGIPSP